VSERKVRLLGRGDRIAEKDRLELSRRHLFQAIEDNCPHVVEALATVPDRASYPAVTAWAARFNLSAEWAIELAIEAHWRARWWLPDYHPDRADLNLRSWRDHLGPVLAEVPSWEESTDQPFLPHTSRVPIELQTFECPALELRGYDPTREKRSAARTRLRRAVREWADQRRKDIDSYLSLVDARVNAQGDVTSSPGRDREHYRWAALYLCGDNGDKAPGWHFERIAEHVGAERQTVQGAVSPVLAELGLRARRPGRPRKR